MVSLDVWNGDGVMCVMGFILVMEIYGKARDYHWRFMVVGSDW